MGIMHEESIKIMVIMPIYIMGIMLYTIVVDRTEDVAMRTALSCTSGSNENAPSPVDGCKLIVSYQMRCGKWEHGVGEKCGNDVQISHSLSAVSQMFKRLLWVHW